NGNYVVSSGLWDNGTAVDAGAVTWGSGTSGVAGAIDATKSLVGSTTNDRVGQASVVALPNGNYVVSSGLWDNGTAVDAGALTWGSGTSGVAGLINATTSLVGSSTEDRIGTGGLKVLSNGNYVVPSPYWNSNTASNAGAITLGSGTSGIVGTINAANSLIGSAPEDRVGDGGVTELTNGSYVVRSQNWNNGAIQMAGAVTLSSDGGGVTGTIDTINSVLGLTPYGGLKLYTVYDELNQRLFVVRSADDRITVIALGISGLIASNDGPTTLGGATAFSASVTDGPNVTYSWDFGDGSTGSGASPTHTYAAPGSYSATVTATNTFGSVTARSTVLVTYRLALPLLLR
ncbi:MAG: PKD domain-containing protein, partial [Herpetosiphonaceae bacterium]|nr:PKD domain-containing protein [Herpetosiphonaceae bacterium]